jgi:nucleotide-binding universal stress UspA family protein
MAKQEERELTPDSGAKGGAGAATAFRRMLVAIDESEAAEAAIGLVAEWVDGPGADVHFVQVIEARTHRRSSVGSDGDATAAEPSHRLVAQAPTQGARNRQLVQGIADAAKAFGADVVVLGVDRPRLAGHRLAPSLREQLMRATDLPVLVAPRPRSDGPRQHRQAPDLHRDEERADSARRHVRV